LFGNLGVYQGIVFILWLALLGRLRTRDRLHFVDVDAGS